MKKLIALLLFVVGLGSLNAQSYSKFNAVDNIKTSGTTIVISAFPSSSYSYINISDITLVIVQGGTPANYQFVSGTGTNCANQRLNLTNLYYGTANGTDYFTPQYIPARQVPLGQNVCLVLSAAPVKASVEIDYTVSR